MLEHARADIGEVIAALERDDADTALTKLDQVAEQFQKRAEQLRIAV